MIGKRTLANPNPLLLDIREDKDSVNKETLPKPGLPRLSCLLSKGRHAKVQLGLSIMSETCTTMIGSMEFRRVRRLQVS